MRARWFGAGVVAGLLFAYYGAWVAVYRFFTRTNS